MSSTNTAGNPGLTQRVATGAAWSSFGGIGRQAIGLLSTSIMARLLSPAAYGVMGMAAIFTNFLLMFADLGLSHAIVRRDTVEPLFLSSIFWVSAGTGLLASLIIIGLAGPAAIWFGEPVLRPLLQVLSFSFIMSALGVIPMSILLRSLAFRHIAAAELSAGVVASIVGIAAAWNGAGVWSLVLASLSSATCQTILLWSFSRFRPALIFRWREVQSILSFSANLSGFNILNYVSRNADNFIIGSYLGAKELGYYQLAYNLMLYPLQTISGTLGRVLFPALSQMKNDLPRFRAAYLRVVAAISLLTFPMMLGLAVVAQPMVRVFLGPNWTQTGLLLAILAPVGMIQSVGGTVGHIYTATGRTDWMLRWGLAATSATLISFVIGKNWGSTGVAIGYAIVSLLLIYPNSAIPNLLIGLPMKDLGRTLAPMFVMSLAMGVGVEAVLKFLGGVVPAWVELGAAVVAGVAIYGFLVAWYKPSGYREVANVAQSFLRGRT